MRVKVGNQTTEDREQFEVDVNGSMTAAISETAGGVAVLSLAVIGVAGSTYVASTGVAATDKANLQAAHDAFPATGGTILLDAGPYDLTLGINLTKPTHLLGSGPSQANIATSSGNQYQGIGTSIVCTSLTAIPITVNADGCSFEKLSIVNTAADATHHASAGAGIKFSTLCKSWRMVDVLVRGFYICVDTVNGKTWQMDRCWIQDAVLYGVRVQDQELPDAGDMIISNSYLYSGPNNVSSDAIVYWASGGGLKMTGNKLVAYTGAPATYAVHLQPASNAATSVIVIVGNSIEDCTNGIQIESTSTSGRVHKIVITGNEILATTNAIVLAGASTSNKIKSVTVTGNVLQASGVYNLSNCDGVKLFANEHALSGHGFDLGATPGITNLTVSGQNLTTAQRQAITSAGFHVGAWVFDTDLNQPLFSDGTNFRDGVGTIVS